MKFKVVLYESDEGFAVFCPSLPGCVSQGETREEALEEIRLGIREFLEVIYERLNQEVSQDLAENEDLSVYLAEVDVDVEGVQEVPVLKAKV